MPGPLHVFLSLKEASIHYLDWHNKTNKQPILFVHDLAGNAKMFSLWAKHLSSRFRLISCDLRGHGESSNSNANGLNVYINDINSLLDYLHIEQVNFLGSTLGAAVGLRFATDHPQKITKLLLVDGGGIPDDDAETEIILKTIKASFANLPNTYPSMNNYLDYFKKMPIYKRIWNTSIEEYFKCNALAMKNGEVCNKVSKGLVERNLDEIVQLNYKELYSRIRCPVLLIKSSQIISSNISSLFNRKGSDAIIHAIPNCNFYGVNRTNHFSLFFNEQPKLMKEIVEFVDI